ncbi:MAG TPA: hypothetical protein H9851_06800 [Candidatus Borkfalkia faecavium]|uniref:MBG domain-containing protein n=1 Tax=Candidatus Borkfalkia faecavium TaxID=2838508 RepID=A0A9D2AVU0_9FIRM|nr:hypothetical protein [Candidatus Borkfalkia faecavium]
MTRAKKVILALICAAALCCAAIGGVLLARPAAEVRAEMGDLAIASVDGQIYDINTIDEIKEMLTVTRVGADGQARPIDEDEYTLTIEYEGEEVTMVNGIFPESYFGTDGNRTSAEFTLTVKDASDKTATTTVTVQWAPDPNQIVKIAATYDEDKENEQVKSYTPIGNLNGLTIYSLTVQQVRDGVPGTEMYGNREFLGDLSAERDTVSGTQYNKDVTIRYTGNENLLVNSCTVTVTGIEAVNPSSILVISTTGATTDVGSTFTTISSEYTYTVMYEDGGMGTVLWDNSKFAIDYYTYQENSYVLDSDKEAFDWTHPSGREQVVLHYTECGKTVDSSVITVQLNKTPYSPLSLSASNGQLTTEGRYGEELQLIYQFAADEEGQAVGSPWIVAFQQFNNEAVQITSVEKAEDDEFSAEDLINNTAGTVSLTDVGTYTVTLTISGGYYWNVGEGTPSEITYTVTIIPAELDLGVSFTGETENDAGEAKDGWTYGGNVTETANGTLSVGETDILTVTGNYGDGEVTYHFLDAEGSEIGTTIPTNAGNYYVYVSVAASADGRFAASSMKPDDGTSYTEWAVPFIIGKQEVSPYTETTPASDGVQTVFNYKAYTGKALTADENDLDNRYKIVTNAVGTDVGNYNVVLQLDARNNYRWEGKTAELSGADFDNSDAFAKTTVTFRIVKAENELTVNISGWTYGETASEPSFSASFGEPNHTYYRLTGTGREPVEDIAMAGAGDYVVVATIENTDNYGTYKDGAWGDTVAEAQFTIARQGVDLPSGIQTQRTYDYGNTLTAWNGSSEAYTVSGNTETVTGDYTVTFTLNDNYQWKESVVGGSGQPASTTAEYSVDWSVAPLAISVPTGSDPNDTYDGSAQTYTFTGWTAGKNNIAPISVLVEEGEAVISDAADAAAGTVRLTDAGSYTITLSLTDTTNFVWADGGDAEREFAFTINKANNDLSVTVENWTYDDGSAVVPSVSGNNSGAAVIYTVTGVTDTSYSQSGSWPEVKPVNAGQYTLTASVQETDNYNADTSESVSFTISQKGVTVGFASDKEYTYTGAAVDVVLTVDDLSVDLADNEYFTVVNGCAGTDAGSYTATIAWKGNYKENGAADDFATAQRSKEVGTWTIDPFAVSLPDELAKTSVYSYNGQFVGTQQTWKWDNYNGFGTALQSGTPFNVTVSASGSGIAEGGYGSQANGQESGCLFATEAGTYTFTLELTDTKNFVWASGGTDAKELTWTIGKAEVSVDVGEQQLEYDGNKKAPANIVDLNAGDTSVPSAYQNLYTITGYAAGTTSTEVGTEAPNDFGTYYVAIDLKDGDNFVWKQAEQSQDVVSGNRLFIWYQITGTTYEITIGTISGWTYGTGTPSVPTLSGDTEILQDVIENYDSAITYTYQRQGEGGQWTTVYEVSYDAGDASYLLSVVPAEVADTAGTYRLIVDVSAPSSNNYAPIVDEYSNPFTISPYTLKEDDIAWSEKSFTYKGSAYTYGTSADNDVYARHYTYSYENGSYVQSSSADAFFSLTLTSGGDAFTDAGSYTFTASTESGNYALSKDLAAKTYTIARAELTISVTGTYEITYGDEAPTQFTFGYDTLLGNDSAEGWGVTATTDYEQFDPISSDTVKYTISIVEKDYDPNYTISYVGATLTVKAAELTVSVNESVSRTYDGVEHPLQEGGSESIYGNIVNSAVSVNGQEISWKFATAAFNADGTITSGGSEIGSVRDVADSGTIYYYVSAPNHVAQRGSVQIAITPAELTLTAKDASVVYGEDFTADTSINSYTVQIDGSAEDTLLGSDTKESVFGSFVPSYQAYVVEGDTYNAGDGVTESGYIAFDCSTPQLDNYTVTLQSGSFTVSPRAITVTIEDVQQTYGDGAGDYASAYTVAFTQPAAGVSETPIFGNDSVFTLAVYDEEGSQIVPDNKTNVGVYYIVGSSSNDNYAVTFSGSLSYSSGTNNAGKYEIVARVLGNLDWTDPDSLEYDGTKKVFTATGKYGEGENAEEVSFTITYQRQTGEGAYGEETSDAPVNVGSYKVIARSDDPNFTQGLESTRTFTITPYTVTIDWNEEITLVYNGEEQSGKVSATYQPVAGDAIALAVTPDAEMKDAAEYTLTASFAEDDNALGNYALPGVVTQKYTISPRPIKVTIENKTSEYGDALKTLTATETLGKVTGWTDGGKDAIVPGDAKPYNLYIQDYTGGHLAVGSHNIFGSDTEEGDAIDANYDVTFRGTGSANHGVYTVNSRAVTIEFAQDEYTATYGTQFDFAAAANAVTFARGTAGTSGSAFADGESFASVLGETQFAVIAEGYSVTSAAGSAFTMQMQLGNTAAGTLRVGNYTFTFTDTAGLTVGQRAIAVTIADKTDIVYGTDAVANTQLTATAALASGTGEAIVNGDTEVYSLAVYDADKNEVTRGTTTPAGEYFIVGKAENNNYAITFIGSQDYNGTGDAGLFEIVVSADGIRVEVKNDGATVTYTGEPYYLLLTGDAQYGPNGSLGDLANTLGLGAYAVNADWTDGNPFLWEFRLNDENGDAITSLTDVKDDAGSAYTVWYKVYLPSVTSYAAKAGTFTVTIAKAENGWTEHYEHTGWAYKGTESGGNINLAFDGLETGSRFTPAAAEFGTVSYTYYGSRSGSGTEDDPYVYGDEKAKDFFNNDTPAGTYYVKVEVAGTKNYTALTDHHQLVVSKHVLTVGWVERNVPLGTTQNTLTGYDTALMSLNEYAPELTLGTVSSQDKTLQVTFADTTAGTFYVTLALSDGANYAWMNPLSSNEELCRVSFSVALANNEVTITADGWTYGDVVTVALPGESAGAADRIVITATHVPGDDNSNVQIAYAYDDGAATEDTANGLSYVMGTLPTQAGTYWVRVLVTGDDTYAMGEAYAKFTIEKFQVAVPEAGAESSFTYDGGVKTYKAEIGAYDWADETTCTAALVKLANGSTETVFTVTGNRAINAGSYTAAYVLADADNYEWASSWNEEFSWVIAKAQLARPTIGSSGTDFIQTEYDPDVTKQLLAGFDPVTMSFEGATVGAAYYPEGGSSYLYAENAGTYEITLGIKDPDNYEWKDGPDTAKTVLTWTIAKAEFDIHNYIDDIQFAVGEYVYNGQVQYPRLEDAGNLPSGVRLVGYEVTAGNGTDAGAHTVTATFALTGSHADNYTFAAGGNALTQKYTIDKAVISGVTWTVQRHYTYNGEDQFDVVKAYYGLGGSIHELQVGVQEFKNYQEGGYTFTVEGFKAGDENAKNYTLSGTFSETFYIDKLSVYIVVGEATGAHTYDGQRPTPTEYGFGKVAVYDIDGDDLRDDFIEVHDKADWEANMMFALLDADGNEPSAWNVGSYIVTVTGAENLQNYDVTRIQTGTLEIVPKEITITGFDSPGAAFGDDVFESAAVTAVDGLVNGETIDVLNFLYTYTGTADDGWTADGTLTNEMHAGSYTVTVSLQGGNYVLAGDVSYIYKVSPMLVDPGLVEIDDLPYTGQAQTLTKEDTRFTGTGSAYDLFDYSVAAESGTEVGGYRVTLIIGNVNYLWQSSAAGYGNMTTDRTWRIVEALAEDISVSLPQVSITHWGETAASVTAGGSVAAIGGTEISVNITYLFEVKDESGSWVEFTGSVWNAGDYRVRAEAASDNFPAAYSEYHEFTVQPGVYDVSGLAFADMTLTYDGQAHGLVLTVNGSAAAGGSIGGGALGATGTVAYALSAAEADAGTYTMTATLTAGANYTFAGGETAYELTGTLVIEPYTVTIRWAEDDFTYDKQDHSGDVWAYFIGAGNSHIDLALEGADEMTDAGEYTFTVAGASDQSGAAVDLANYMLAGGDVAGAQKEYTVRKFAAAVNWGQTSFTYNGEDQSASVQPSFIGVGGEEIVLSVQPQALQDFGTYTVAAVIGAELKNYELSNTTAQIFIAKLPVTVTADDISAALGAAEQTLTYTLAPSEAAEVFAADEAAGRVEVSLSRVPGTAAGAYDIYISVTGEGAENYALTLVGGTYTIRERAIELSIELPADLVYSGAPKAAVLIAKEVGGGEIAVPAGITLWYEGKDNAGNAYASAQAPVNAGSYTVGVRIDTQDYDVSNANITVEMTIERAEAFIDVSGVQTQYTYTGALQRVEGGAVLSHGESALVYSNNTFTTVSEGDGKVVSVDAAASCNYKAAHAEVTITVAKAAISPAVSIHGWTYGQSANGYTVTGNPGGGAIEAVYGGTTNAGAAYSGGQAPTEAGSYTLTVTVAETENYLGGSASTSFTVARAALHVSVSIEGWAFGESPNGYTVSPASMRDTITSVRYAGEGYSGSQPPTQVGSYTLTVTFAQTANYQGGSASDSFSITQGTLAPDSVRLTIEGWTYGEAPNSPVLTGAPAGAEVSYRYSGTANDGTAWNSDTAPSKAGSYKVTAHISAAGYASFEAEASFTVARRLVAAPTLGDTGGRTASSVYDGEEVRIAVTGYDGALMDFTAEEGTQLVMEGQQLLLAADAEGTYVLQVSLKDIYNYGWADLAEGEQIAGDIALAWEVTLAMHSLLWLIILLFILLLILIALLVVFAKKDHDARARIAAAEKSAESGADGAADERQNYALAPAGLLFAVPVWQISLIAALAVAAAVLLVADVVLLVLWRKDAAKAERAEEAAQAAAAAAQDENLQAENAQAAGGDENSASAE